jgi:hypothetical protein
VKIFVVGSCQALPLARCLAAMNPSFVVERYPLFSDLSGVAGEDDIVFRQRDSRTLTGATRRRNEFLYPRIWFKAFHPDATAAFGPWGTVLPPMGEDHSSLVVYGWTRGMSAAETARLFCEPVFERLGFFDCWQPAKRALLEECNVVGLPFEAAFARLERSGCFMRLTSHPALIMMAEIARALVRLAGLPTVLDTPENYLDDPFVRHAIWPVYPEIADRLGLAGSYVFKPYDPATDVPALFGLDEFIARSYETYAAMSPGQLLCGRVAEPAYLDLERVIAGERRRGTNGEPPVPALARAPGTSPYADLPSSQFWRRAVERVPEGAVDPVGTPPFRIARSTRIATVGSCFAQHMSSALSNLGYTYFVAEPAPPDVPPAEARRAGYGVFSTRSGNVYTPRQLLQLFDRAYGTFVPSDRAWLRADGRYADPFRPEIEPHGFASIAELEDSRDAHFAAVRTMFERLDVLVFTMGLTEAWRSAIDGAVFPLAPGVSAGCMDASRYEFVNFTVAELREDVSALVARLARVNAAARVIVTVSPQPPIATYEPRHVVVSAAYTKAALRAAADEVERAHEAVWYFPAYELIVGSHTGGAYFERDRRTVTPAGVAHVMQTFLTHCAADEEPARGERDALVQQQYREQLDVVCDEEMIERDRSTLEKLFESMVASSTGPGLDDIAGLIGRTAALNLRWTDYDWYREFLGFYPLPNIEGVAGAGVTMPALDAASMRAPVEADIPCVMRAATTVIVPCTVRNDGAVTLTSGGKHPVFVCYRWYDSDGQLTEVGRSIHTPLPAPLGPGDSASVAARVAAPRNEGNHRLCLTLLQSEVAWFDDVDPANGVQSVVEVTAKSAAPV